MRESGATPPPIDATESTEATELTEAPLEPPPRPEPFKPKRKQRQPQEPEQRKQPKKTLAGAIAPPRTMTRARASGRARVIALSVSPTEYIDDQAPATPPPTTTSQPTLDVVEQLGVVDPKPQASSIAKAKAPIIVEPTVERVSEPTV